MILLILCAQLSFAAPMAPATGELQFLAVGSPSAIRIAGKAPAPTGTMEWKESETQVEVSGELRIALSKFETGIALRDSHMKDKYLEVGKYPEAVLTLARQALPKNGEGPFSGDLFLHGVRQPVNGKAVVNGDHVKASFSFKLEDFGVETPSFANVKVTEAVNVDADFSLVKAKK